MRFLFSSLILLLVCASSLANSQQIKVNIRWDYKDFPGTVNIYEVKGKPRLWETKSVSTLKAAPLAAPIEASVLTMSPGQDVRFALVVQNTTDKPLYFFAAPHVVHPVEHSLGFKFKCLCINHAYVVGPKETWFRIVEFRLSKDFVGPELTITHSIIGIDKKRADSFSKEPVQPDI